MFEEYEEDKQSQLNDFKEKEFNRQIQVKDMQGTKGCPNLFCNVIITEIKSKKNQGVYILGLSKKEVEDLYLGLKILIIKELNEK